MVRGSHVPWTDRVESSLLLEPQPPPSPSSPDGYFVISSTMPPRLKKPKKTPAVGSRRSPRFQSVEQEHLALADEPPSEVSNSKKGKKDREKVSKRRIFFAIEAQLFRTGKCGHRKSQCASYELGMAFPLSSVVPPFICAHLEGRYVYRSHWG